MSSGAGDATADSAPANFPVAEVREGHSLRRMLLGSKMWWVTLLCLAVAVFLAWQSLPDSGTRIVIYFPEGHGLRTRDALRHRGIDVGTVEDIRLKSDLDSVRVSVLLVTGAEALCREGSRFWIERPQLSLSGVRGLETAVGAKYIAVSPGPARSKRRTEFTGLPAAPPDALADEGLELLLRSGDSGGLNPGAPVTWRGVQVGDVLTVGLSPDARHVDAGIRIQRSYRDLVTTNSRF